MYASDPLRQATAPRRVLFLRHPFAAVLLGCPAAGALLGLASALLTGVRYHVPPAEFLLSLSGGFFSGAILAGYFFLLPLVLSVIDFVGIFKRQTPQNRHNFRIFAVLTLALGILYSLLYGLLIWNTFPTAEWYEQLYNVDRHQPVWTGGLAPVLLLAVLGLGGYILLNAVRIDRLPPLAVTLSIAAMYLGAVPAVIWCLQIGLPVFGIGQHSYASSTDLVMCLLPADYIILVVSLIRDKIHEWNERPGESLTQAASRIAAAAPDNAAGSAPLPGTMTNGRPVMGFSRRFRLLAKIDTWLSDSAHWPLGGLLLALPLLGVCLALLVLFGQMPDRFVRAWTETADWGLSQKIPPQNAFYDEHYLCTVAAGGHERIVRPMRRGERHGHRVVVNRQLCIANAFEQLLEERTPRFHRRVRRFYDTYGFPLSRLIRTKGAADLVWLLMKPLEWGFLFTLYLFDVSPENRIAVQYMPGSPKGSRPQR